MVRILGALLTAVLLTVAAGVSVTLVPDTPHVKVVAPAVPAPATTTTVDWRPYVRAVAAVRARQQADAVRYVEAVLRRDAAIRYAAAWYKAHARPAWVPSWSAPARFDQVIPFAPGCDPAVFGAYWHGSVAWAITTAREESGCSPTARNQSPCNSRGDHAIGVMQECGYSGPLTVPAELTAAWSLCVAQIDAWSWHGPCR